jgi:coenzyme F420-reducing hydrogenase delta subunit
MAPVSTRSDIELPGRPANAAMAVTAFICANCFRPGQAPDSGGRPRPTVPEFKWPFPVTEVLVPCTGRIQPEHVLKAFESGADVVLAVACEEDNCHYLEGSKRCARRAVYLRSLLDEVGLGGGRLLLFHLPGTAAEDMGMGAGQGDENLLPVHGVKYDDPQVAEDPRIAAIRDAVLQALSGLTSNPLYTAPVAREAAEPYQEVDTSDDANQE